MARIAFFTLNAYDMITGGHEGDAVGGAQVQQILIGKELAARGHEVYFVEYMNRLKIEKSIDGIQIVTKPLPTGSEFSRSLTVLRGTKDVLNRIKPDVCYRRSLDFEILPLSLSALLTDTRFVYGIAHDDELSDNPHKYSSGIKNTEPYQWLNRKALSNSDAIIAQNSYQYDLAKTRLNTPVHQIPNCYGADEVEPVAWEFESPVVFWAARFEPWKRPEVVAELARELPHVTFVMAGGPGNETLYEEISQRSENLSNLKLLGHVPFSEIDRYFAAADIFLNTSSAEGFPNTFLQAWAQKTPVLSLQINPDDILTTQEIGFVTDGSVDRLQDKLEELTDNAKQINKLGLASYEYLRDNHTVTAITDRYEHVFLEDDTEW